ncbi:hypothetical protein BpHYR1_049424 [Brachionus plicatilis]|uniref:Uncharacterized protein n=1 Tax=Brachionus plicatilis TaxID=10195 RepID=A0A3M7QJS4_BRAPC|nr:hypothetical protein BpHYR1_049424 [Brachionus plicatilis]
MKLIKSPKLKSESGVELNLRFVTLRKQLSTSTTKGSVKNENSLNFTTKIHNNECIRFFYEKTLIAFFFILNPEEVIFLETRESLFPLCYVPPSTDGPLIEPILITFVRMNDKSFVGQGWSFSNGLMSCFLCTPSY